MKKSHYFIDNLFYKRAKINSFLQKYIAFFDAFKSNVTSLYKPIFIKSEIRTCRYYIGLILVLSINGFFLQNAFAQVSPDFVNTDSYPGAVSNVTVTMPSGSVVGDLILIYIVTDDDGDIVHPAAFTELYDFATGTAGPQSGLFYRIVDGTESATYDFSFPSEPAVVTTLRYNNINTAMPFDVTGNATGNSTNPQAPSVTTTQNDKTLLQFIGVDGASAGVLASNSGTSSILAAAESGPNQGAELMIVSEYQAVAGTTPIGSFSFANEQWTGITIALNSFNIVTSGLTGTSCGVGMSSFAFDYSLGTSSGTFELVDPLGNVIDTKTYSSATGSETFNFTPSNTGQYTIRDQANTSISSSETFYIDSDGDSVCDDVDIDDDNDGIIDYVESPNCFFSLSDFPFETGDRTSSIGVTTEWTVNNGNLINILNGNTADNAVRKTNGDFVFSGQEFLHFTLSQAFTFDQIIIYHEGAVFLDEQLVGVVQGSNDGSMWTDLTTSGVVLPDAASPHTINLTESLADYIHYRIFVTSGRIDDDEYLREVEFSMIFDPSNYPKPSCVDDFDGDLIFNHLDLDSDDDLCSDALEAGATIDLTADFQFPIGDSGANGLPDAVETMAESGIINYTPTYPYANSAIVKSCFDSDGDSVIDLFDLDDDNDGIADSIEISTPCPGDGLLNWTSYTFPVNLTNTSQLPGNTVSGTGTSSTIDLVGMSGTRFGLVFTGYINITEDGSHNFTLSSDDGSSLHIDGNEIINITGGSGSGSMSLTKGPHQIEVRYYENTGGESLSITFQPPSAGAATSIPSILFSTILPPCDTDGIPSFLDLDSDGDGIPDNIEAQPTLGYVPPNSDSPATYVSNNGVNSAYLSGFPFIDTDSDSTPDFLDIDTDSDTTPDSEESGLSLTGIIAPNGLDMGVKTSDDYSDVNGIVDNPDTDLAKVTTTTAEVDYRDKEPPIPLKVCHTSGAYNIGGTWFTFADDKLLNPANFGDNGTSRVDITLHNFGNGTITEAALIANGCQVFQTAQTNDFNATEHAEINSWAQSIDHVLITSQQNVVLIVGPEYPNSGGNSNPNNLTEVGENVVNGPFGMLPPFNQGGSYQGAFDDYPEADACVIIEDAADRPTGLLNRTTGDFYLADADLLSELGGLTSNNGISSSTDILFANLYHSIAQLVTEGPTNACDFFFCPAGEVAPSLTSTEVSSAGLPVDLNTLFTGTPPDGATLTWHNASPVADENYIGNAASFTDSGVVYAAFRAEDGSCYSPFTPLMVTVNYPDLEVTISPATETSASGEVQSYIVTVTNNGPITAPDAVVKIPIPPERQLILANPSMGAYSGSTYLWSVGQLVNGQSETLDITIRL